MTAKDAAGAAAKPGTKTRLVKRDPERTRAKILEAATDEFTKHGLGGARVDRIAKRAGTNERMLYYYFVSKDQLFLTVLENVYIKLAEAEKALDLGTSTRSRQWRGWSSSSGITTLRTPNSSA